MQGTGADSTVVLHNMLEADGQVVSVLARMLEIDVAVSHIEAAKLLQILPLCSEVDLEIVKERCLPRMFSLLKRSDETVHIQVGRAFAFLSMNEHISALGQMLTTKGWPLPIRITWHFSLKMMTFIGACVVKSEVQKVSLESCVSFCASMVGL